MSARIRRVVTTPVEVLTGLPQPPAGQGAHGGGQLTGGRHAAARRRPGRCAGERRISGERKAAVLGVLLTQPGQVYDVTSPDLPTIS